MERDLHRAFGIAVHAAAQDVSVYNAAVERTRRKQWLTGRYKYKPYEHMCVNCEKMTKQIVRWGKPSDEVVENFSPKRWEYR